MWPHFDGKPYSKDALAAHINSFEWTHWRPKFIVVHNTSSPTIALWLSWPPAKRQQYIFNARNFYIGKGWPEGPHFFAVPQADICTFGFSFLGTPGINASCFNARSIGVEQVGEFNYESYSTGPGALVRDNTVHLLALLHNRLGIEPEPYVYNERGIHFHIECRHDNHDCPGKLARNKPDLIARVKARMAELHGAPPIIVPPSHVDPVPAPAPAPVKPSDQAHGGQAWVQASLNTLERAGLTVDGDIGPLSKAAIKKFQMKHGIHVDGIAGRDTIAAIDKDVAALSPAPPAPAHPSDTQAPPSSSNQQSNILMTEFAGPGEKVNDTINGYTGQRIDWRKPGVALPYHFRGALPRVKVMRGDKSVVCDIVDIGPHVASIGPDPYWDTHTRPRAETHTANHAGMDATPAVFGALGVPGRIGTRSARVDWEFV